MNRTDDKIIKITDDVSWTGILDYDIKTFDIVMTTEYGTTYNSFFINAEKKAIVDIAKEKFSETYFSKLRRLTDPADIEYIIVDHTEPDHSGSLAKLLAMAPGATVVGSGNAIRYLEDIINKPFRSLVVKDGDTLDLGNKTLRFIAAPNLHWPDTMYTYLQEDRILFSCDSFGAHYCSEDIFSEFTPGYTSSFKYYFDVILKPFSRFMLKAIERINPLDIDFICPGHGPVHGNDSIKIAKELSARFAEEHLEAIERGRKTVLVAYVSAYGYTKEAAELIASGMREAEGIEVVTADIENSTPAELERMLTGSAALVVGSPTINQNTLLPIYTLFAVVNPIRDRGKMAGTFGSYGWSGEAPKIIVENLKQLKFRMFEDPVPYKFSPSGVKAENLVDYGRRFGQRFSEECGVK